MDIHSSAGNLQKVSVFSATEATDDFFSTLHSKPRLTVMDLLDLCSERLVYFSKRKMFRTKIVRMKPALHVQYGFFVRVKVFEILNIRSICVHFRTCNSETNDGLPDLHEDC
jgi:hypothetical protein